MDKKKSISSELQSWHWFIPLFVVPFVMFFCMLSKFSNSYAMTVDEVEYYLNYIKDNMSTSNVSYTSYINFINSNKYTYLINSISDNDIESYNLMSVLFSQGNNFDIRFFQLSNDTYAKFYEYGYGHYIRLYNENSPYSSKIDEVNHKRYRIYLYNNSSNVPDISSSVTASLFEKGSDIHVLGIFPKIDVYNLSNNLATDIEIYNWVNSGSYPSELISYSYTPSPQNTITLTSTSNHKFGFNDFNQCQVTLTGDWQLGDFTYYIERYENNEWVRCTDLNDWYYINGYDDPYYVIWHNINYLPVGVYRYCADLGNTGENCYYSDSFNITYEFIENEGSATGTYDNGEIDVDVTIDTGETIDNIKDFLGQDATVTDEQFSDNFPTVEIDDPSEDFFSWIFDQIENIFTSTSAQTLQFELFGTTYSYSSNDVYVPNNALKTMIGLSCDFSICMWIIKDVRKVINKIKEGNIEALSDEDITANMV